MWGVEKFSILHVHIIKLKQLIPVRYSYILDASITDELDQC